MIDIWVDPDLDLDSVFCSYLFYVCPKPKATSLFCFNGGSLSKAALKQYQQQTLNV